MLLGRRDYASFELSQKLAAKGYTAAAIGEALNALRLERLLDDGRYLENFVRSHTARGQGPARMRQELRQLGFGGEAIETAIEAGPDYVALCREVRARKFGQKAPASWAEKGKQARFLQYRGFSSDHIRLAMGQDPETLENPADEHS
ncbi:MAG: regulatory protein RecX [Gammaproteobacteria bacterium]|jgi:regulatory protein|nr:regulatory protein RecX [Gammaproteobacteria bacterium]